MMCPECQREVDESWQFVTWRNDPAIEGTLIQGIELKIERPMTQAETTGLDYIAASWMRCPSPECRAPLVRLRVRRRKMKEGQPEEDRGSAEERIVLPIGSGRFRAPQEVPHDMRADFDEAAAILDLSAQGSAAIGRRVLSDLLRDQGQAQFYLTAQIQGLLDESRTPDFIRDDLDRLREVGNFATHTQRVADGNEGESPIADAEVIRVDDDEAVWLLEVLLDMFEHYYVAPSRRAARRAQIDEKIARAGREPIDEAREGPIGATSCERLADPRCSARIRVRSNIRAAQAEKTRADSSVRWVPRPT